MQYKGGNTNLRGRSWNIIYMLGGSDAKHDPFPNYYDCHKIYTSTLQKNRWLPDPPLYDYKECFRLVIPMSVNKTECMPI